MEKIKRNKIYSALSIAIFAGWVAVSILLVYTRVVNLGWGLPYPFHPDERNMAVAIEQLGCHLPESPDSLPNKSPLDCMNPRFFAYGQFPLYIAYIGIYMRDMLASEPVQITFLDAIIALRLISAISAIATSFLLFLTFQLLASKHPISEDIYKKYTRELVYLLFSLVFIFSPVLIQFSHYGTTESLMMFLHSALLYISIRYTQNSVAARWYVFWAGIITGAAIAVKVSSVVYALLPILVLTKKIEGLTWSENNLNRFFLWVRFGAITLFCAVILSPFNIIAFEEFMGSMRYESGVGLGDPLVFYTRQFFMTEPIVFQFQSIFPYVLGWGVLILFIAGFLAMPFKREHLLLRIAFLAVFLPNAFVYAKWTRFIAPAYPVMLLIGAYFLFYMIFQLRTAIMRISYRNFGIAAIFFTYTILGFFIYYMILPGMAFLNVYQTRDIRYTASDWVYTNIPNQSVILSETANVVDIPIPDPHMPVPSGKSYRYISFNFYDLDTDRAIQDQLTTSLQQADYIFIPSRRIFKNHTCYAFVNGQLKVDVSNPERCRAFMTKYPRLTKYYDDLFSGKLGFEKVAEFALYPSVDFFGSHWEFPDELAEETWTVFDHPVIRIYRRRENS